ncbi:MAG: hypothetical protein ACO30O_15565 [bacterium]
MKFLQEIGSAFDPSQKIIGSQRSNAGTGEPASIIGSAVAVIAEKSGALVRKVFQL